jgi:hypothetical protein
MVCRGCGKESADEFSFCPYCGKQKNANVLCSVCGKESVAEFSFCPHCGQSFTPAPPVIELPNPSPEEEPVKEERTEQQAPTTNDSDRKRKIGTYVFGAFSVLSLLVSIVKGIVPIYLVESAAWAGAAWYWHRKKTHTELATAIVIVLAGLVAIGEVIQVARHFGTLNAAPVSKSTDPFEKYAVPSGGSGTSTSPYYGYSPPAGQSQTAPSTGPASAADVAEIEQQAVSLYKQKRYSDARSLFDQACNGGEMRACNYLGYLYAQGLGGARDTRKARDVYQRACDQGTLSSCASLGSLYQDAGDGDNARKYFQKACNGGIVEGCDLLRDVK